MYFKATEELIKAVSPYVVQENITESYFEVGSKKTDHVVLESKNNVGFEVVDNEIVIFWLNEHTHFEDYSSQPNEGEDKYIDRAKEFLIKLFRFQIRRIELRKRDKVYLTKYYIVYDDGREDEFIGGFSVGFITRINPFVKKLRTETIIQFNKNKGEFLTLN